MKPSRIRKSQRPNRTKRGLVVAVALVLLIIVGAGLYWFTLRDRSSPASPQAQVTNDERPPKADNTIRLIATGDMLPHDTVNKAAKTASGYDYAPLFSEVKPFLTSSELSFCNQESPTASGFAVTGYPTFNAPNAFAEALRGINCNVINLANNHSNDKGQSGINQTRDLWDTLQPTVVAGTARAQSEQDSVSYFEKAGMTFAFLSYTKCSNDNSVTAYGLNMLERSLTDQQLAEARQKADMIIVGMHWCRENTSQQEAAQETWAQYFATQDVDVVIGTGPHWLQPVQKLAKAGGGETVVWYSLGNFLSTQEELEGLIGGIAVMDIDINTKSITGIGFMPTYMHYEWTSAQQAASDYLARTNLKLYPLDASADPLSRSLLDTTVAEQTARVTQLMNTYTQTKMLTSETFFDEL